ncbi:MAG: HDOD domain-containing protein [Pyrinomonadaceae bacterium]|nr:HDOD domain-containing protein [Pyrinomonadaceae bacterium]
MLNILFVDDDPVFLKRMQAETALSNPGWTTSIASDGIEALTKLGEETFDVLISDMKMSGMDGVELLRNTKVRHPDVVRIILTGYEETAMVMKSLGTAHQYLAKPSDVKTIQSTIRKTCALRDMLKRDSLREMVSTLNTVPSLPTLYSELMDEVNSADPSIKHIGQIVEKDIGMTVKILQIVNSAFFGLQRHVSNATDAVMYLGIDTITSLTLSLGIFAQFDKKIIDIRMVEEFRAHSESVGAMAKLLASTEKPETAGDAFTAGLVHDIGELVLAYNMPEEYSRSRAFAKEQEISLLDAELELFGATHAEIGAYLLSLWGIPWTVVEAVAYHHKPSEYLTPSFSALTAVHMADVFHNSRDPRAQTPRLQNCDVPYLAKLGLLEKVPEWHEEFVHFFVDEEEPVAA